MLTVNLGVCKCAIRVCLAFLHDDLSDLFFEESAAFLDDDEFFALLPQFFDQLRVSGVAHPEFENRKLTQHAHFEQPLNQIIVSQPRAYESKRAFDSIFCGVFDAVHSQLASRLHCYGVTLWKRCLPPPCSWW